MLRQVLVGLFVCWAQIAWVAAEPARVALLIGNKDYEPAVGPLINPHNDVEIVGAALQQLGFAVTIEKNADYKGMDKAIRQHVTRLRRAGQGAIGFFYYSGHGAANPETNTNYLIPVDAQRADTDDIWDTSLEQSAIIDRLYREARQALHIIVFDACRDELNLTLAGRKALGAAKGFAPVADVRGMLIAYATAEKRTAADTGRFAKILAEEIVKPGVEAVSMFREVQLRAEREMQQEPWMSLRYLPRTFLAARPMPPVSDAAAAWKGIENTDSKAVLEEYIRKFGGSVFAEFAKVRLAELPKRKVQPEQAPSPPRCDGIEANLGGGRSECIKPESGKAFRDCADCPEMVVVPAGRFQMGSLENEQGRGADEGPEHEVRIPNAFAIGQYEITVGQYLQCVRAGDCKPPAWEEKGSKIETSSDDEYKTLGDALTGENFPIVGVSWNDAVAYTTWLSKKTQRPYRLPSEAEWEYAARAGTTGMFSLEAAITTAKANYNGTYSNPKGEYRQQTMLVRSFQPNGWGLYQVHGNVLEWVEDCWYGSYLGAPSDNSPWVVGTNCSRRVLRGGAWNNYPMELRAACRSREAPDYRSGSAGFRVSRM